jgi:ribosome-binding factor A
VSFRRQRAEHDVRDRLATILEFEVRDPRLEGVHLTGVELSPDYSYARIFYRVVGDREAAAVGLERSRGFIRKRLGESISLRRIPDLDFRFDDSVDRGDRIDQILRELRDESGQNGQSGESGEAEEER